MAVFCGSSAGPNEIYKTQAAQLGRYLASNKIHVVFGGGKVGMMGILADAALEAGGKVTGVIPGFLHVKEVAHDQLTELITVKTMHQRKALIEEMSDGAIALPGGFGTLDEAMEVLREAGTTRPEAANSFMDYAFLHLEPNDGADYGLATMQRWPERNIIYQTHRNLLFAQRIDEAAQVMRAYEQRFPLHPLMIARQACAENRTEEVREILDTAYGGGVDANSGNPLWLVYKMLGQEEEAMRVLRNFEFDGVPYLMANWLFYPYFDPAPFPALMAVLERENVDRPTTVQLPYACTQAATAN